MEVRRAAAVRCGIVPVDSFVLRVLVVVGCMAGCKPKAEQRRPDAAVSTGARVPSVSAAPKAASVHSAAALPEADVRGFVARWEAAH